MQRGAVIGVFVMVGLAALWAAGLLPANHSSNDGPPSPPIGAEEPAAIPAPEPPAATVPVAPPAPQPQPAAEAANVAEPPPPAAPAPTPTEETPTERSAHRLPADIFSEAFDAEARDPMWAPQAEQTLRAKFAELPPGSLQSVECRAALCKLELLFDQKYHLQFVVATHSLREDFSPDFALDHLSNPSAVHPERITGWVPRKGYGLRDFDR